MNKKVLAAAAIIIMLIAAFCFGLWLASRGEETDADSQLLDEETAQDETKSQADEPQAYEPQTDESQPESQGNDDDGSVDADGLPDEFDPGYTDRDLSGTYDPDEAVVILLSDDGIEIQGEGAQAIESILTITEGGVYLLSGSLSNGQIVVNLPDSASDRKVQLVFNGVDIACADGPAVWIQEAKKVFVTLAEGSRNSLKDGQNYADESDSAPTAALYSTCDLTINGSGALSVYGCHRHGIATKDSLVITGGTITVTAEENGLKGKDSVAVCGGEIYVEAGNEAVKSDQDNSSEKGWISINGGTLTLTAQDKGLQALNDIYITDGTLTVDADNDCLHSNDSMRISGGVLTLTSRSKGMHADDYLTVDGGTIDVLSCTEGMEAMVVTINDGDIRINASDDGINATDGTGRDEGGMSRGFLSGLFGSGAAESTMQVVINGGYIYIAAKGDGIDSNGSLTVNGGTVYVDGPTSGANGALDYGSTGTITGGTVVAVGSVGMAVNFSSAENQCSWMISAGYSLAAGSTITVTDSDGREILSYTPQKDYRSVVVSCPELRQGGTYTISVDGTELATAVMTDLITGSGTGFGGGSGGMNGNMGGFQVPDGFEIPDGSARQPNRGGGAR